MYCNIGLEEKNDLKKRGMFDSLFHVNDRFKEKHIYLYTLNNDTKAAIVFLAHMGVRVSGFVVEHDQENLLGIQYLGKPVSSVSKFKNISEIDGSAFLLDIWGRNIEKLGQYCIKVGVLFDRELLDSAKLIIYGAGKCGRDLLSFLNKCDIKPDAFWDINEDLKENTIEGIPIISFNKVNYENNDRMVIIAINDSDAVKIAWTNIMVKGIQNIHYYNSHFFELSFRKEIWGKQGLKYIPAFIPQCAEYIIHNIVNIKIYLWSHDIEYLEYVYNALYILGIHNIVKVSDCAGIKNELQPITDAFDLIYEDGKENLIWALNGEAETLKKFVRISGINIKRCLYSSSGPLMLDRNYILDVHLGYIDKRRIVKVRNHIEGDITVKIGVLGGSTSDYDLYYEKSWIYWLLELSDKHHIPLECYVAATAGNTAAQEEIRLVRDLLNKKLDMIISWSGINEYKFAVEKYKFAHYYQKMIFEKMEEMKKSFFDLTCPEEFSMGEEFDDTAQCWCLNQRIMHSVCMEFGIKFHSFLQPCLLTKKPQTLHEIEMRSHVSDYDNDILRKSAETMEEMAAEMSGKDWFHDMRNIFDNIAEPVYFDLAHVLSEKNKIIAENVWKKINLTEVI